MARGQSEELGRSRRYSRVQQLAGGTLPASCSKAKRGLWMEKQGSGDLKVRAPVVMPGEGV